jgi:hypothetical protein
MAIIKSPININGRDKKTPTKNQKNSKNKPNTLIGLEYFWVRFMGK